MTSITNEQMVPYAIKPTTATGKPAKVDPNTPIVWSVVDSNGDALGGVSTITDSTILSAHGLPTDGTAAFARPDDDFESPGGLFVKVEADADLGAGVQSISATDELVVSHANAKNLGLVSGPAIPKE